MNRIQVIYDITIQLKEIVDQPITGKTREATIEKLNKVIMKKGVQMEKIKPPFSDEEHQLSKALLPLNEDVQNKMQIIFADLKTEMKQIKQQKKSNQSYTNPYKSVQTMDGMFMDQKK